MKKITFTLFLLSILYTNSFAQQKRSFWSLAEVEFGASITDSHRHLFREDKKWSTPSGHLAVHVIGGYDISSAFSLGLGLGVKKYSSPTPRTLIPIILDARLQPFRTDYPFVFNYQLSYNIVHNIARETTSTIGIGYKVKAGRWTLIPSIGYNYLWYSDAPEVIFVGENYQPSPFPHLSDDLKGWSRHSLFARIGVIF